MSLLNGVEQLGKMPDKAFVSGMRISMYLIILSTFFFGMYMQSNSTKSYSLSYIFGQDAQPSPQILGTETRSIPYIKNELPFPAVSAKSIIAVDLINNKILFEKNMHTPYPPASTTKLMTALVAIENFNLNDSVIVPEPCTNVESTKVGLVPYEEVTVNDLVQSLLISSAGDSACTLASVRYTPTEFIELMNQKAFRLGMSDTEFSNAIGLDGLNYSHISSAYDLYTLAKEATTNPIIGEIVSKKEYEFESGLYPRTINSTNELLWTIPGTVGIKTGRTTAAGEVLIYEFADGEQDILIVVMNSLDRFSDTQNILEWLFATYSWES